MEVARVLRPMPGNERPQVEWIDGRADRWTSTYVHVAFADPRAQVDGAWLRADDVKRRTT
jgi:hypothetical protein